MTTSSSDSSSKIAFIFPGQGSQSIGMMSDWGDYQSIVDNCFNEASEALGYDLKSIITDGPAEKLNNTEITQPAMLASGVASFRVWEQLNTPSANIYAGHSLGEYSALVCAGSLQYTDAIKLVAERGRLMQSAVAEGEGAMAAIIGLSDEDVIKACESVEEGIVSAVNFNSPGQVVIAGNKASVENAMDNCKQLGAKRTLPLPVSVPSHSALMQGAADLLHQQLLGISMKMPAFKVIHNQNAGQAGSVDEIRELLKLQLFQPVLWVDCVNNINQNGVDTLIEFGPGKVLTGLTRRINKAMTAHAVFNLESLEKTKQILSEK
ncbi:MAG: ACP S-malonyltransferase [Gammaproteobacteria bacterium]|jgi:[acyl-carrier-protein] S-malonyltransferase|nr:ACP S-malonyltransferase [Gammaproteobacteria bacterium]MBT3723157.1 ACP S-malonyltransferase [Gammaproteobacteria bacterium]MBT4075004.1 ACP S-malonyltransferase [Gammaproteobacteria bacterium]MBT4196181.1 ACP S-malonyltransferase [Gammaproteobacteria bacterium]MBT4448308.1 ACP S-malonyltransferase [Gammaproteobacteria bacterium]